MTIQAKQLRDYIIRPVLAGIGLYSQAAEDLVFGTAMQESGGLTYIQQLAGGPAVGLYQMEPKTHDDVWQNFLAYRTLLADKVSGYKIQVMSVIDQLHGNLYYATAMCRVHYYRQPQALPSAGDIAGYARYWKEHYNSAGGAGTVEQYVANYKAAMGL